MRFKSKMMKFAFGAVLATAGVLCDGAKAAPEGWIFSRGKTGKTQKSASESQISTMENR